MKRTALVLLVLSASAFGAGGQSTSVSESNSYSTGANITNQNVFNNADHMVLGDVECPKPTIGLVGGTSTLSGNHPDHYHVGIGINIPLSTEDCDEAAKLQVKLLRWNVIDREQRLKKEREQHEVKMANSCSQIPANFRPEICNRYIRVHSYSFSK